MYQLKSNIPDLDIKINIHLYILLFLQIAVQSSSRAELPDVSTLIL